jgi:hypothetical protein
MEKKLLEKDLKQIKRAPVVLPQTSEDLKSIRDCAKTRKRYKQQAIMYGVDIMKLENEKSEKQKSKLNLSQLNRKSADDKQELFVNTFKQLDAKQKGQTEEQIKNQADE